MNSFKVSLDNSPLSSKTNPSTIHYIDKEISSSIRPVNQNNIKSFVHFIANDGCALCPGTYKSSFYIVPRDSTNFIQQQLFVLDFDKGTSIEEIKERAVRYNIPILCAYDTHSNGTRVLWLNDGSVRNHAVTEAMQKSLMVIYPEADSKCKDISRLCYGGKRLLHFDESTPTINIDSLFMNMSLCLSKRHGSTHYKRKIAEFSEETGIRLNDRNLLDVSLIDDLNDLTEVNKKKEVLIDGKKSTNSIIVKDRNVEKLPSRSYLINLRDDNNEDQIDRNKSTELIDGKISAISTKVIDDNDDKLPSRNNLINLNDQSNRELQDGVLLDRKKSIENRLYRSNDLVTLSSNCQLYREFESGDRLLPQRELDGLASVLIQAATGDKRFKSILEDNSYYSDQPEMYGNWDYYFYYIKGRDPSPCASFCPHQDTCLHGKNAWSTAKIKYHQVEQVENYNYATREEAEEQFKRIFSDVVEDKSFGWHVIKSQTAIGKTQEVLRFLKKTDKKVLIVVPTNVLKRELQQRAKDMGIEILVSPSLHELKDELPDDVWSEIEYRYDTGKSPVSYIKKLIAEDRHDYVALFKQYLRELDEFNKAPSHTIATHRRLTYMEDVGKYDLVIVDEDIILSTILTNRGTIPVRSLKKLMKELAASDPLAAKIKGIIKHMNGCEEENGYFTLAKVKYDKKTYAGIKMAVNIPALCSATHFCVRKAVDEDNELEKDCIVFQIPIKFPENTKYIMLSATVDKTVCEHVFGTKNVRFHECNLAEYEEGTLYQDCSRSMSRANIAKDTSIFNKIAKFTGFDHTISFKKFQENGSYKGELTFSNCAGIDDLCGKNINVIGTPHQTDWIYKLFASSHGFNVDTDAPLKHNIPVVHNGFRFRFSTYDDELLRAIQFYIIESDLEQAVGRARLLRKKCTVNLFSNFPLRQSKIKKFDYDTEVIE